MNVDSGNGSARRRRERQLRSWLRHQWMTVRMELVAALHHSAYKGAGPETNDASRSQPGRMRCSSSCTTTAGWRPQERVQRHTVECLVDTFVPIPILDVPVPQSVDQPVDVMTIIDISSPLEQVIDVPKIISQDSILQRAALRGGTVRGRVSALRPRVFHHEGGWHGSGTVLGRRWLPMVPVFWTRPNGELLVEEGRFVVVVTFVRRNPRRFPCFLECVSFPKKSTTFFVKKEGGVTFSPKKSDKCQWK